MIGKTKADVRAFLTSSGSGAVLDAIRNIIVANLMGPYMTGLCMTLMIIPQIVQYINFGLIDALQVLVPRYKGMNRTGDLNKLKNTIFNISLLIAITAFLFILFYVFVLSLYAWSVKVLIIFAGSLVIFWPVKKYFVIVYAANDEFKKLSIVELCFSTMVTVLQITLVYFWDGFGFWLGFIFANIFIIIYLARDYVKETTIKLFSISFGEMKSAIPLGVSMLICGVTYMPFIILARLFLVKVGGVQEVGYFVLAMVILTKMSVVPSAIAKVIMPKISRLHAKNKNLIGSYELYVKAQLLTFAITSIIFFVGIFLMKTAVSAIMPKYIIGIPGAKMALLAGIPFCLIDNANNFILALEHKRIYLLNIGKAIMVQLIIFAYLWFAVNVSAYTVSISLIFVFLFYAIIANLTVFRLHRNSFLRCNSRCATTATIEG